jgi:D-inositol-3-phosphate glycosyltransferase
MISFVWSDKLPLYAGRGGTETYTIGHVRELNERGTAARIVSIGLGQDDGHQYYPDIEFLQLTSPAQLSKLDDIIVYVNFPFKVPTKHQSFVIFHFPPLDRRSDWQYDYLNNLGDQILITNSRYMRGVWADFMDINQNRINVVYPFADPVFASVKRVKFRSPKTRVLFAGRLMPEKGIYLFMEALHHNVIEEGFSFTATNSGNQTEPGKTIEHIVRHNPLLRVIQARTSPSAMAKLYASYDIVVVPSNHHYWHEGFGMVSVEAQHSGCRVIASNADGLPETNCGELMLFQPDNSYDLAKKIARSAKIGPLLPDQRSDTISHFTRASSVNALLKVINRHAGTHLR